MSTYLPYLGTIQFRPMSEKHVMFHSHAVLAGDVDVDMEQFAPRSTNTEQFDPRPNLSS